MIDHSTLFENNMRLVANNVSCRRGGRLVFEGLSFELSAGQYLSLRGRNGTGKSTLLRLLAGLLPAHTGRVMITADGKPQQANDHIIMSGHLNGLKPAMTLRENLATFHRAMTGYAVNEAVLETAARQFDLMHLIDQPVQYFSSGQRHRSSLMRFMVLPRRIWLMDEPTVGLDTENRTALAAMMRKHLTQNGMIIAATHDEIDVTGKMLVLDDFAPKPASDLDIAEAWL